ncbi:MAG: cytochrome c-type biogenesis protein [Methylophilaceae bacterium]
MMILRNICIAILLVLSSTAYSADSGKDPEIEARLKHLSNELRCLVCQNTTLADSDAPLAQDLRNEVRKLMEQGKTDDEVVAYLVARYGDFVTFRPPVNASTALLWFGPFAMLIIGLITLVVVLKKRAKLLEAEDNTP